MKGVEGCWSVYNDVELTMSNCAEEDREAVGGGGGGAGGRGRGRGVIKRCKLKTDVNVASTCIEKGTSSPDGT